MDEVGTAALLDIQGHRNQPAAARVGRFLWRFVQTVLVINAGMMVCHTLYWTSNLPNLSPGRGQLT